MPLEMPANDMIAAFELGRRHRQEDEDRVRAKEERDLRVQAMKIAIQHEQWQQQAEEYKLRHGLEQDRYNNINGLPTADLTPEVMEGGILPSRNAAAAVPQVSAPAPDLRSMLQGAIQAQTAARLGIPNPGAPSATRAPAPAPQSGTTATWQATPNVQRPPQLAAQEFTAPPPELTGGVQLPGYRLRPHSYEELMQQAIALKRAEQPLQKVGPGESIWDPYTRQPAYTNPNDKTPSDEFSVNYIRPALELATKAKGSPLTAAEQLQVNLKTRQLYKQADTDPVARAQLEALRTIQIQNQQAMQGGGPQIEIKPDTREFKIAQDLAYGKVTLPQFRMIYASRGNAGQAVKSAIYAKAGELNPGFNPAQFEMGFKMASNPKIQQQLSALDNVLARVPDLLEMSDAASRSGIRAVNKIILPAGFNIGGKRYSDFHAAQLAFADELSGALGFGSATDMSRQMGINMTDPTLPPENFASAIQNVVVPFSQSKRDSMLKGMGVYGQPGMNQYAPPGGGGKGGGAGTGGAIRMMAPDGSIALVPADAVDAAKAKGAKVIQ